MPISQHMWHQSTYKHHVACEPSATHRPDGYTAPVTLLPLPMYIYAHDNVSKSNVVCSCITYAPLQLTDRPINIYDMYMSLRRRRATEKIKCSIKKPFVLCRRCKPALCKPIITRPPLTAAVSSNNTSWCCQVSAKIGSRWQL